MQTRYKAVFITIVPSPYQRDLFAALAARGDVDLRVYYLAASTAENPWPERPLWPFEKIMSGFPVPFSAGQSHVNWGLPDISEADIVVLSGFTSLTGQWLMRCSLRGKRWLFWGERLRRN